MHDGAPVCSTYNHKVPKTHALTAALPAALHLVRSPTQWHNNCRPPPMAQKMLRFCRRTGDVPSVVRGTIKPHVTIFRVPQRLAIGPRSCNKHMFTNKDSRAALRHNLNRRRELIAIDVPIPALILGWAVYNLQRRPLQRWKLGWSAATKWLCPTHTPRLLHKEAHSCLHRC